MSIDAARLAALHATGFRCARCDYGQQRVRCECLLPCGAPGCGMPRVRGETEPELPAGVIIPDDITSGMTQEEALALAELARGKIVIELGAWHGYSTVVLASVADYVISVDWHMGDAHAGLQDTWEIFNANLRRYGVNERVMVVRDRFETALPLMAAEAEVAFAGGCFIDAQHDAKSVARDLALVLPMIKPGGFVCFHDYGRSAETGNDGFAVTEVADKFGVAGTAGHLAWGFKAAEGP